MTKPRLGKVRALFYVFQQVMTGREMRVYQNFDTPSLFDNEIQGLFHCEFCYLVANFDNVETWGYGD